MFDLQEELKKLPAKPGVYLMHDKKDAIIYVGKAVSLKNRVRQYFQASRKVSPKIEKMISQIVYHYGFRGGGAGTRKQPDQGASSKV